MTKTIEDRISEHNAEFDRMMVEQGYTLKRCERYRRYVDSNDKYVPFPDGYVTGPHYNNNGNPQPWSYSMNGKNGWLQMAFRFRREADDWIAEKLDQWDAEHSVKAEPAAATAPDEFLVEPDSPSIAEIAVSVTILLLAILGMWLRGW